MFWVLSLVLCVVLVAPHDANTQCFDTTVQVEVKSYRNQTGHWVSQISMLQDAGPGPSMNSTEPWLVQVQQKSSLCHNKNSMLETTFLLTAPATTAMTVDPLKGTSCSPGPRSTSETPHPQLGLGYELFPGVGYYKFHTTPKQWAAARKVCAEEGAHLTIINSEKEADVIKTLFARHPTIAGASDNDWLWVGVERKDNKYVTIFGDSLDSTGFTRWHPGQPNKNANDNCILNHRISVGLGDVICDWILGFTCEREL